MKKTGREQSTYDPGFVKRFQAEYAKWEEDILKDRIATGLSKPRFHAYSGAQKDETKDKYHTGSGEFEVKPVYTPLDIMDTDPIEDIGIPGEYPFTRGRDPLGYRAWRWPLGFYSGHGSSEEANKRFRALYDAGSRQFALAFDLPTQIGLDSDDPLARGEVGKVGLAVNTIDDLQRAFEGIPLEDVRLAAGLNSLGPWIMSMFHVLYEKNNLDPRKMRVRFQNDPFKEFTGRGTYIFSPRIAVDLGSDVVEYVCKNIPGWEPQYTCTTTTRWAGASASQEIGFGIANLISYIEAARAKGVSLEDFVPRLNMHMSSDSDLFEEVAKFRATRRLWAKITSVRFKTEDPAVTSLRITTYTASNKLTAQEPLNNVIRTTIHVLASILGGAEHILAPAYDEALAIPTFESTRLANLTTHILHDECFTGNTVDPLGGSYYVEHLTNQLEERAREWYDKVEAMGGAIGAMEQGFYLKEMADGMYRYQREVEDEKRMVIGVNKFVLDKELEMPIFKGDPHSEKQQIERLHKIKKERSKAEVAQSLAEIRKIAEAKAAGKIVNIIPAMMDAVRARVTVGEICNQLQQVFGPYEAPIII